MAANDFIPNSTPVRVSTLGIEENIYFIIVRDQAIFLRTSEKFRTLRKASWTTQLTKAVLFDTAKCAMDFARETFHNVEYDL